MRVAAKRSGWLAAPVMFVLFAAAGTVERIGRHVAAPLDRLGAGPALRDQPAQVRAP